MILILYLLVNEHNASQTFNTNTGSLEALCDSKEHVLSHPYGIAVCSGGPIVKMIGHQ